LALLGAEVLSHARHYRSLYGESDARTQYGFLTFIKVTCLEAREAFTRWNILHLWDWVCTDLINLGVSGSEILGKSFFHIGTRNLQGILARLCFICGVNIVTGVKGHRILSPDEVNL
jgi:hypothetical protein